MREISSDLFTVPLRHSFPVCSPHVALVILLAPSASHTVLVLLDYGCKVTLIDNYSNSFPRVFDHMKKLAGDKADRMTFVKVGAHARQHGAAA